MRQDACLAVCVDQRGVIRACHVGSITNHSDSPGKCGARGPTGAWPRPCRLKHHGSSIRPHKCRRQPDQTRGVELPARERMRKSAFSCRCGVSNHGVVICDHEVRAYSLIMTSCQKQNKRLLVWGSRNGQRERKSHLQAMISDCSPAFDLALAARLVVISLLLPHPSDCPTAPILKVRRQMITQARAPQHESSVRGG